MPDSVFTVPLSFYVLTCKSAAQRQIHHLSTSLEGLVVDLW